MNDPLSLYMQFSVTAVAVAYAIASLTTTLQIPKNARWERVRHSHA